MVSQYGISLELCVEQQRLQGPRVALTLPLAGPTDITVGRPSLDGTAGALRPMYRTQL